METFRKFSEGAFFINGEGFQPLPSTSVSENRGISLVLLETAYAEAPGNVRLPKRETKLPRASVVNVSQVAPLHRMSFSERVSCLSAGAIASIDEGLRLIMDLASR